MYIYVWIHIYVGMHVYIYVYFSLGFFFVVLLFTVINKWIIIDYDEMINGSNKYWVFFFLLPDYWYWSLRGFYPSPC